MKTKTILQNIVYLMVMGVLFGGFSIPSVRAAAYTVSPLVINLDVEKRDILEEIITLTNTSDTKVRLYAAANTVATDGDGIIESFVQKSQADRTITPTTWIEISRQRIELMPGEQREIPFTVRMNPEVLPGKYSVFIGFGQGSNRPTAQAKIFSGDAPGVIVQISVDQVQNNFLRLEKFTIDKVITGSDTQTVLFTLANPGNTDVIPAGEIIYYDNSGAEVIASKINLEETPVPANGNVLFNMEVPSELPLGKYKAFLSVEYGEFLTAAIHDTAFFYVVPLKQLIILFISALLFAVIVALYLYRKYDRDTFGDGSKNVALYIKEGKSDDQHHDIDLSKKENN